MNIQKKLLVTTAIKETFGSGYDGESIFLGEWCSISDTNALNNRIVNSYLKDREKFEKDYYYLEQFYERLLDAVTKSLNLYHNTDYQSQYWRVILGPWLLSYVSAIWNRWENLRNAFEEYEFDETIILDSTTFEQMTPSYHSDAIDLIANSHYWNHCIFAKILKEHYKKKVNFINIPYDEKNSNKVNCKNNRKSYKHLIAILFDKMLGLLQPNEKIVISSGYFNFISLFKILIKFGQVPRLYSEFDKIIKMPKASSREEIVLAIEGDSHFELFVKNNIVSDIPIAYVEGFSDIKNNVQHIFKKCEVIFSANSYWHNDLFKVFCAEKVNLGKKMIISQHGGAFGLKYSKFRHEDRISNIHIVWHNILFKNQMRLPPNKIIGRDKSKIIGTSLLIVGFESSLYLGQYRTGSIGPLNLDDCYQKIDFIKTLNSDIMSSIIVRPQHPSRGWGIDRHYSNIIGNERISYKGSLRDAYDDSKIIVCSYPETTFFEALHSGKPTILLYMKENWDFHSEFSSLISIMEDANILFTNPVAASNHINKIWDNPNYWWNLPKVVNAREEFFDQCGRVDDNWLDQWGDFFKEQLIN